MSSSSVVTVCDATSDEESECEEKSTNLVVSASEWVVTVVVVVFRIAGAWTPKRVLFPVNVAAFDVIATLEAVSTLEVVSTLVAVSALDVVPTSDLTVSMVVVVFRIAGAWKLIRVFFPLTFSLVTSSAVETVSVTTSAEESAFEEVSTFTVPSTPDLMVSTVVVVLVIAGAWMVM